MATLTTGSTREAVDSPAVVHMAQVPALACGECRHHMPQATSPASWCTCRAARWYDHRVDPRGQACGSFALWPEGGPAAAFIDAMRC